MVGKFLTSLIVCMTAMILPLDARAGQALTLFEFSFSKVKAFGTFSTGVDPAQGIHLDGTLSGYMKLYWTGTDYTADWWLNFANGIDGLSISSLGDSSGLLTKVPYAGNLQLQGFSGFSAGIVDDGSSNREGIFLDTKKLSDGYYFIRGSYVRLSYGNPTPEQPETFLFFTLNGVAVNEATGTVPFPGEPVPEPLTWLSMIVGFGLAGWQLRRKPHSRTAASLG